MTSTIRTNMTSVRAHNIFESNNAQMNKAFTNVSTGMRLNSVQDSPADWAISERMRERINSLNQAQRNVQNDTAMMKTAEGAITNTVDVLRTLKARVMEGINDAANANDRQSLAKEIKTLFDQIEYNATSVRYNNKLLLAAVNTTGDTPNLDIAEALASEDQTTAPALTFRFQIGDDTNGVIENVSMPNMTIKGLSLENYFTAAQGLASAIGTDINTGTTFFLSPNGDTTSAGNVFLTDLNAALDKALGAATEIGSFEQRLGYTADNVATQIENLEASDSAIRDSDMAKEVSNYMKWQVLSQASQYMLAQSNQNAFSVLNLLQ